MPLSADENLLFFKRVQNVAVAFQNLREEAARLRAWFFAELKVGGVDAPNYADTSIATKAEAEAMIGYLEAFQNLNDNVQVAASGRSVNLIPFLTNSPAP